MSRDPTSFESFSSGINRISSYVASNLHKKRTHSVSNTSLVDQHYSEQVVEEEEEEEIDRETVTFAAFDTLDQTKSCLMIGYQDGFQVWDITSPDNVHEICSIRDKETLGAVSCIHLLRHVQNTLAIV